MRTGMAILLCLFCDWAVVVGNEFPTTRFYDAKGKSVGSATSYSGGVTKFYDARGNLRGSVYGSQKRRSNSDIAK
jgi:hypothetical protein